MNECPIRSDGFKIWEVVDPYCLVTLDSISKSDRLLVGNLTYFGTRNRFHSCCESKRFRR